MEDYYNILNVPENSTKEEIKKSFRKLSLQHHPDKGGNHDEFTKINEAFSVLYDDVKRQEYDFKRKYGSNMNMNFGNNGRMFPEDIFNMFFNNEGNNFFNHPNIGANMGPNIRIFRNGVPVNVMQKPSPIIKTINITLEQTYNGMNYPLEIERWIKENDNTKRIETETIYIDITRGIDNNEIIIIEGKGNIINENNKGDVKLFIKIINETEFTRNGLDLIINKELTLKEALCGFSFVINHFNNKSFTITNNNTVIQPNNKKIIKDLGMVRNNIKGNIIINFSIIFPENISDKQREILRKVL